MARLGVDRVRLTASWSSLAPEPNSKQVPKFNDGDPEAYPREPWTRLDQAVKAVTAAGLMPQIDVAFFAPRWAVERRIRSKRHKRRHRWEPDPELFGRFAEAVARRYSGRHQDPARPARRLPAVRLWTTWNEPNYPAFLAPQWRRVDGTWVPRSPHLYREMHERAYASINRIEEDNQVLLGGTAARGDEGRGPLQGIAPLHFLRELACVDRRGHPLDRPECEDFKPLEADGYSHHPYTLYDRPDASSSDRDDATLGDLDRLSRLLGRLHRLGRINAQLPIFVTEYGYETNPPDVLRGVSLRQQARYHGLATFLAWKQQDVTSFAQFLLNDIGTPEHGSAIARSRDWQSGLYFNDGQPKPAVAAFKVPFWAHSQSIAGSDVVVFFGQVRPSSGRKRVEVEMRTPDGTWTPIQTYETRTAGDFTCGQDTTAFLTDEHGFYLRIAPFPGPATYRARWIKGDGKSEYGATMRVGQPSPPPTDS
jgi:hypothetical protein